MRSPSTKVDSCIWSVAFDTILNCIDIVEDRLMEFEELKQIIGKDFIFYLQINLRKLKDGVETDSVTKLVRGMYLVIRKLQIGYVLLMDSFTFLKVKKYNILSFLTMVIYGKLLSDSKTIVRFHRYLTEHKVGFQ